MLSLRFTSVHASDHPLSSLPQNVQPSTSPPVPSSACAGRARMRSSRVAACKYIVAPVHTPNAPLVSFSLLLRHCIYHLFLPNLTNCAAVTPKYKQYARLRLGETNPLASPPGSIRGDFCIELGRNIIHGSDSPESAAHELAMWFKPEELNPTEYADEKWVYEK